MPFETDGSFAGLYVLGGRGRIICSDGAEISVEPGRQLFVSAACKPFEIKADEGQTLDVFLCRGPQK